MASLPCHLCHPLPYWRPVATCAALHPTPLALLYLLPYRTGPGAAYFPPAYSTSAAGPLPGGGPRPACRTGSLHCTQGCREAAGLQGAAGWAGETRDSQHIAVIKLVFCRFTFRYRSAHISWQEKKKPETVISLSWLRFNCLNYNLVVN